MGHPLRRSRFFPVPLTAALVYAVLALCGAAAAAGVPHSLSVTYNLYFNGAHVAVMNETFEARGSRYRIVSESVPVGVLAHFQKPARIESSGSITADGLRPARFEGRRIGSGDVRADFDWETARLSYGRDGRTETVDLPRGTQDRLSAMYQFMFHRPDGARPFELSMTDGRRLARYRYDVSSEGEIDTPLGREATIQLARQSDGDGSGNEIWLAPRRHYLPVKMRIRESNGARYEQIATRVDIRDP